MPTRFRKVRGGVNATIDADEAPILRHLVLELVTLIDSDDSVGEDADPLARALGIGTATTLPDDPALARLFPDAYADDPHAAGDFRRYTEGSLRERKREDARVVLATLDRAGAKQLWSEETAQAWLRTLTALRLTLGARLEITEEIDDEEWESWPEDDERKPLYAVYSWLGWVQELLVRTLW
ncbi:MAG: DUF2017 domain-containing protein [Actinomycetes bacterium]